MSKYTTGSGTTFQGPLLGLLARSIRHAIERTTAMPTTTAEATAAVEAATQELATLNDRNAAEFGSVGVDEFIAAETRLKLAGKALEAAKTRDQQAVTAQQRRTAAEQIDRARDIVARDDDGRPIRAAYTDAAEALACLRAAIADHVRDLDDLHRIVEFVPTVGVDLPPNTMNFGATAIFEGRNVAPAGDLAGHVAALLIDVLSPAERQQITNALGHPELFHRPAYATTRD